MRDTVDGLNPRICPRPDCVMSSNADARTTAPVRTWLGSGMLSMEGRGIVFLQKKIDDLHSTAISAAGQNRAPDRRRRRAPGPPIQSQKHGTPAAAKLRTANMRELRRSLGTRLYARSDFVA